MKIIQNPDSINDTTFSLKDYPLFVLVNVFCGYVLTFSLLSFFVYSASTDNCPGSDGLFGAHCFAYCFPPPSPWRVSLNLEL